MEPIEEKQKGNIELKPRRNKYTVKYNLEVINMIKKGISLHTIKKLGK